MPGLVTFEGACASARSLASPKSTTFDEIAAATERLENHVLGFEVAVHDTEIVRFTERRQHLAEHVDDATERKRPLLVGDAR